MQDIYETFEFYKIKEALLEFAKTEIAKEDISNLVMLSSLQEVEEALKDVEEFSSIITRFGPLPIATSANALYLIDLAKKTGLLTPRDLNLIATDVLTSQAITRYLDKVDVSYPRIKEKASHFFDLAPLEKEIHRVITNSLTIDDKATPELKEIRNKIRRLENSLQQKVASLSFTYSKYLNDDNATIRDGHFVLPVKTANKNSVPGIVYDVSDSGATTFIEPMEIVQINNDLTALKVEEQEEIRKILKALTALVLMQEKEIINNNKIIGEFDFISAKSLYAGSINAEIAGLSNEQIVDLKDARHPLIDQRKVVSNSYYLNEDKRILVISGPNAGGKTVSLKTVGLLTMMNQCGLAIPASKATLGYFNNIYIDIGDNQSLSDNLSTFSAHMSHLGEITARVKGKDLVLIDELGTGTDPKEGEALAFSIMKTLEDSHCLAMISSHFAALKEYAFLSQHVENSSMVFDEEKLLPTYRFRMGAPGKSYALDVATRYGINENIVLGAKDYINKQEGNDTSELLNILQKKLDEAEKMLKEANETKRKIEEENKRLEAEKELLKNRRDTLLESVNKEKEQIINNAKEEVEEIISMLSKDNDLKLHEVIELKKKLEELEDAPEDIVYDEEVHVGDYVSIPALNITGKVNRINGNKAHILTDSGMAFDSDIKKLHKCAAPKEKKVKSNNNYELAINTKIGLELNLIGMHVEEAKTELIRYLDAAQLKRLSQVRIIHGFGSGALRKMVREYLDSQHIKYRPGDAHEGAGGATVVIFHD
ncbi:MAG: endonuclease MutS2 [Bacilli bacterium]|nr:endonuclease MutS2 [Bacilli bacterium]